MIKLNYQPKEYICSCCGLKKPETEFNRQSYTGLPTSQCKVCIEVKRSVKRHELRHNKFVAKERHREMRNVEYPLKDWSDAMVFFAGQCCYCGAREGRSAASKHDRDHLIPLSKGGKTVRSNVVPACRRCNRARGNRDFKEWYVAQPFYDRDRLRRILEWMHQ